MRAVPGHPSRVQAALIAFVVSLGLVALWLGWRIRSARQERPVTDWQGLVDFDDEVDRAGRLARSIAQDDPDAAQYATPMAYRVRYRLDLNLRELFHLVELRSARGGHESYRWIAQQMGTVVCNLCPWLSGHLRVDREHYDFARQG